ncbi:MAG: GNAT family N-acetyltransferase [Oscillospiraceae bacterium]|nr:GNAT family N-acetyltransferase [Oscillospiraceae bacterium]
MTTIYLIRHAEAEGNLYRRCHGHYDSTVTDNGYRQIAALARRFTRTHFDAVYASDLTRTKTTALAIARVHDLPLRLDPRLREVGVGAWEDRTWAWLARFDRERLVAFNTDAARWRVDGAETMADVRERMLAALRDVVAAHPNATVAAVSHGMALRLLVGTLQGLTLAEIDRTGHAENTAVTKLEADERGIRVVCRDDASHLPDALTTLRKQAWTRNAGGVEAGVWFAPDASAAGRFDVMREDERVGAVAVKPLGGGVAEITELWLDESERGKGYGARLLGQAVSRARALGCDTLRSVRGGKPWERYFGYDEGYRIARFDAAWEATKNDG